MLNDNQRIELHDSQISAMAKLAEGNIGALTALMTLSKDTPQIDPDSAFGPLTPLFDLDVVGLYGHHIWMLWKCINQNSMNFNIIFRAAQLGIMNHDEIVKAAMTEKHEFDFDKLKGEINKQLPRFGKTYH